MADIHEHAGFFGVAHLRPEFPVAVEQAAGLDGEHMGHDVARTEILEHLSDGDRRGVLGPALADMDEQRQLQRIAELAGALQRLHALRPQRAADGHDFDADDNIAVGFDGLLDLSFIDQPWIGKNAVARTADAAESGELDVIQYPRFGIVRDVVSKNIEKSMARAAGVDNGGYARADAEYIRIDAEGAETFHQVQVNIDQTRRDDAIFDVDNGRAVMIEVRSNRCDSAIADMDVENSILAVGGIYQATAFQ